MPLFCFLSNAFPTSPPSPLPLPVVLFPGYHNYVALLSDNIGVYVCPSAAQVPCSQSFFLVCQLKFFHTSQVCCLFTGSMVCLDFLTLHTSHAQPANYHPHSVVLMVIDCHLSDTNTTCLPREHLRPSILEPIAQDPGGLLRLFVCSPPCTCNIGNLFLAFPTVIVLTFW